MVPPSYKSIQGSVKDLSPITIKMVRHSPQEPLWNELVRSYHYLGHSKMPGAQIKYLAFCAQVPIGGVSFRAASRNLMPRDCFIGWSQEQKEEFLTRLANNNRFVIFPWVKVKNLASHLLSRIVARLPRDWYALYGQELLLLEAFVDSRYFNGTVYKASNWIHLGETLGYTPKGSKYVYHGYQKEVFVLPLRRGFRNIIGCQQRPFKRLSLRKKMKERGELIMMLRDVGWDPEVISTLSLAPDEVKVLVDRLVQFVDCFKDCFNNSAQIDHALAYLKGLSSDLPSKSIEPIAITILGVQQVRALQHFFTGSNWDPKLLLKKSREKIGPKLYSKNGMVTIDSCEKPKKGIESAGVGRQYCGNTGKIDNCQSGVYLGYANEQRYSLLDFRLFVLEHWFSKEYEQRRRRTDFPADLEFQTKEEIALSLLNTVEQEKGFEAKWVGMDSFFGRSSSFRDAIGEAYYYFADIPQNTRVWLEQPEMVIPPYKGRGPRPKHPKPQTEPVKVADIASNPNMPWEKMTIGEGAKGPIVNEVLCQRVVESRDNTPGPEVWLVIRKNGIGKTKYAFCNAPADIPKEELVRASSMRWSIEQLFQEGKQNLGMDDYEVRSYPAWHRHMSLVILLMHFFFEVRLEFMGKKTTLPSPWPNNSS